MNPRAPTPDPDDEIRELLGDLYADDAARVPEFTALWHDAERRAEAERRERRFPSRWWLAAAAVLVAGATIVVRDVRQPDPAIADLEAYPSIVTWTPPTDGLMSMAASSIAPPMPVFGSVLDGLTMSSMNPPK